MLCTAITTADQWFWSFLISRTTPYMITSLGYGTYMFFGALMVIMGFWALFFIPETKGLSLEDMDRLFSMSTCTTVWQSLVQRRNMKDVIAERTQARVVYNDMKKETFEEHVEAADYGNRHV